MPRWKATTGPSMQIIDTETGEANHVDEIADTGDVEWIAGSLAALDALVDQIKVNRNRLDAAMEAARVRGEVTSADVVGGVKLPRKVTRRWTPDRVVAALGRLVDDGVIAEARAQRLAPVVPTVKPDGKALVQLLDELPDDARETLRGAYSELVRWTAEEVTP